MKQRCRNARRHDYARYGGRGITICGRWLGENGFANFLADMGERPRHLTLDRINVNGNYEPGNCRWASRAEQTRNRRITKLDEVQVSQIRWLRLDGGFPLKQIAAAFGVTASMVGHIAKGTTWRVLNA